MIACYGKYTDDENVEIPLSSIRFRVVSNSNDSADIQKKLELKTLLEDYLYKKIETAENVNESDNNEILVDNISINMEKYEVKLDGKLVTDLKPKEIQLLYFFLTNKNQVFTREQLLDKVWGYEYFGGTRTVDVHIKSVREKLYSKNNKWEIKTIWNVGYKFEVK